MALPLPGRASHANGIKMPSDEASVTSSNNSPYNAKAGLGPSKGYPSFSVFSEPLARLDRLSLLGRNEGSISSDEHVADDPIFSMNKNISVLSTSKLANQNMPKVFLSSKSFLHRVLIYGQRPMQVLIPQPPSIGTQWIGF